MGRGFTWRFAAPSSSEAAPFWASRSAFTEWYSAIVAAVFSTSSRKESVFKMKFSMSMPKSWPALLNIASTWGGVGWWFGVCWWWQIDRV